MVCHTRLECALYPKSNFRVLPRVRGLRDTVASVEVCRQNFTDADILVSVEVYSRIAEETAEEEATGQSQYIA